MALLSIHSDHKRTVKVMNALYVRSRRSCGHSAPMCVGICVRVEDIPNISSISNILDRVAHSQIKSKIMKAAIGRRKAHTLTHAIHRTLAEQNEVVT